MIVAPSSSAGFDPLSGSADIFACLERFENYAAIIFLPSRDTSPVGCRCPAATRFGRPLLIDRMDGRRDGEIRGRGLQRERLRETAIGFPYPLLGKSALFYEESHVRFVARHDGHELPAARRHEPPNAFYQALRNRT
jgi:hypothetical protein